MAEHQQEQYLRQGHASQVRANAIPEEQDSEKRDEGKFDDAVEDPWEPEEPDHTKRWGQEKFTRRRDNRISSQKSTLSERLHSRAAQPSLKADSWLDRQGVLRNELPRDIRKELLNEHKTTLSDRCDIILSRRKDAAAGKIGALLEGTLDRRVW